MVVVLPICLFGLIIGDEHLFVAIKAMDASKDPRFIRKRLRLRAEFLRGVLQHS
jgi:hypothetical protein